MTRLLILITFAALTFGASAEPFRQNERVAFVGDSITHGGSYHTIIQLFYATRYPDLNVACFNVGISGDTAFGGAQRASQDGKGIWNSDVRIYKPTAATIMLGMNDVGGAHFLGSESKEIQTNKHQQQLEWYRANYITMLDNLEQLGLDQITLIKSSAYDQTMVNPDARENLLKFGFGKNDAIVDFAQQVIDVESEKRGYPICDFNTPMLELNAKHQKADPAFTVIGNDRVHPQTLGHTIMAYTFLKFQGLESPVAEVAIDLENKQVPFSAGNCAISDLKTSESSVSFDYTAKALPMPRSSYSAAAELIPFEEELNREMLRIAGLNAGEYRLSIDGLEVGTFNQDELKKGINLAVLERAPQVKQAEEVYRLCTERAEIAKNIRAVVWAVGYLGKVKEHNAADQQENLALIKRIEEGYVPEGVWEKPSAYAIRQLKIYAENVDDYQRMIQQVDASIGLVYQAAQPKTHTLTLQKK